MMESGVSEEGEKDQSLKRKGDGVLDEEMGEMIKTTTLSSLLKIFKGCLSAQKILLLSKTTPARLAWA